MTILVITLATGCTVSTLAAMYFAWRASDWRTRAMGAADAAKPLIASCSRLAERCDQWRESAIAAQNDLNKHIAREAVRKAGAAKVRATQAANRMNVDLDLKPIGSGLVQFSTKQSQEN